MPSRCYCGNAGDCADCCQPYLQRRSLAPSPEKLMRSRYSAFCTGDTAYLMDTLHPDQRRPDDALALRDTLANTQWLALRVLSSQQHASTGTVEFVAFYRARPSPKQQAPEQLHERSQFCLDAGRWYYQHGALLAPIKLKRNDACSCGSGDKFKRCCG